MLNMDIKKFQKRIKETVLYTKEQKAYFISKSKSYSPEICAKLIEVLDKHEMRLLGYSQKVSTKMLTNQAHKTQKMMKEVEIFHKKEVMYAEKELDSDLAMLGPEETPKKEIESNIEIVNKISHSQKIKWLVIAVITLIISGLIIWKHYSNIDSNLDTKITEITFKK